MYALQNEKKVEMRKRCMLRMEIGLRSLDNSLFIVALMQNICDNTRSTVTGAPFQIETKEKYYFNWYLCTSCQSLERSSLLNFCLFICHNFYTWKFGNPYTTLQAARYKKERTRIYLDISTFYESSNILCLYFYVLSAQILNFCTGVNASCKESFAVNRTSERKR